MFVKLDVTSDEQWRAAAQETMAAYGRIDMYVPYLLYRVLNNADLDRTVSSTMLVSSENSFVFTKCLPNNGI